MPASGPTNLATILGELEVPRNRVLYVHSSMDWMGKVGISLEEAHRTLLEWTGNSGTLVVPGFPFRTTHFEYLNSRPHFDVRRSPARVGLLNETLRRNRESLRSLDPDFSVIAHGREAAFVVGTELTGPDPKGADSPFQRVLDAGGCLIGLGVSFNTMNIIHVLDARFRDSYDFPIYSDRTFETTVTDHDGKVRTVPKLAILPELQRHIKPSAVVEQLRPGTDVLRGLTIDGVNFFIWDLPPWETLCTAHFESRRAERMAPCWLELAAPMLRAYNAGRLEDAARARTARPGG